MKKLTLRILALLLVAVMVLGMVACGPKDPVGENNPNQGNENKPNADNNEDNQAPADDASITFPLEKNETFSMFAIVNGEVELPDCLAWQEVEKQTNVSWEVQSVLGAEINEKKSLMLNGGNYPDVF